MSMPTFPVLSPQLTTEESLNMILASVAMEEIGLSHIINAEGEKLQYIIGTLNQDSDLKASAEDVLAVNKSIKCLLDSVAQNQAILKGKMECAVDALKECCVPKTGPTGPTGSTGATGPAGGEKGDKGDKGDKGERGDRGEIGQKGDSGDKGDKGDKGDRGEAGQRGERGATGAAGAAGRLCCAAFCGTCQQLCKNDSVRWNSRKFDACEPFCLLDKGEKIRLGRNRHYLVSFTLNLCAEEEDCLSFALRTYGCKTTDQFVYQAPIICKGGTFTASAGGILIETCLCECPTNLVLKLLSPACIKVSQAFISVTELCG